MCWASKSGLFQIGRGTHRGSHVNTTTHVKENQWQRKKEDNDRVVSFSRSQLLLCSSSRSELLFILFLNR
ncbi:hypothetical protein Csa_022412 [Cucumis sativus]|uniref:Uncharacterized protein n=1 Tax=Cucumis sativus TaxID=3659 RepID=A0A0A0LL91_CUCSA|nr:hypothetical protein Csa_022412 [Cucumis sativus]